LGAREYRPPATKWFRAFNSFPYWRLILYPRKKPGVASTSFFTRGVAFALVQEARPFFTSLGHSFLADPSIAWDSEVRLRYNPPTCQGFDTNISKPLSISISKKNLFLLE